MAETYIRTLITSIVSIILGIFTIFAFRGFLWKSLLYMIFTGQEADISGGLNYFFIFLFFFVVSGFMYLITYFLILRDIVRKGTKIGWLVSWIIFYLLYPISPIFILIYILFGNKKKSKKKNERKDRK